MLPAIMIKNVLMTVVALGGLTVSAISQQRVEARQGRIATNSVRIVRSVPRAARPRVVRAAPRRVYRPAARTARFSITRRRIWVPGHWEVVSVPARYGWTINAFGLRIRGLIEPACSRRVWRPGHWEPARRVRRVVRRFD